MNCHSPLTPVIPAPWATAALQVVPAPIFTTTSSITVGAPTISPQERPLQRPKKPKCTGKNAYTTKGNFLNCKLLTEHPTRMLILSEPGESKDHSSSDSATLNCRLVFLTPSFTTTSINIVGAPTFPFLDSTEDNPRTDLKIGHYISKPKSTGPSRLWVNKNACATKPRRRETQDPASQNEDGASGRSIVC